MPVATNKFRLFREKIKTGVIQDGPLAGNYTWGHGEPVLQQLFTRTEAEVDMHLRLRGLAVPEQFWSDVPIVLEA